METPRSPTRPLQLSMRPPPLLTPPTSPFPPPDPLPAKAPTFQKGSLKFWKWRLQLPLGANPTVSWEGPLLSGQREGGEVGPWGYWSTQVEGAGLTCPKVSSVLDTPVGGNGQVMRAVPLHF